MLLYQYPILTVLLTLELNFSYMVFIVSYRPFNSRKAYVLEIINEVVTLIAVYILCLYAGDVVKNRETKETVGTCEIVLTIFNFLISLLVICFETYQMIRQRYLKRVYDKKIKAMKL